MDLIKGDKIEFKDYSIAIKGGTDTHLKNTYLPN